MGSMKHSTCRELLHLVRQHSLVALFSACGEEHVIVGMQAVGLEYMIVVITVVFIM